ncbi:MAG: type II toxin-antitoxin system VapC family toxin [Solirubrobacterales bacterium]
MIFVDTSFFYASMETKDSRHDLAVELVSRVSGEHLVTTNHVRGETWTLLNSRISHPAATSFLNLLADSRQVSLQFVDEALEEDSIAWLRRHDERRYSFVDATSFAVMRENNISEALAFDGDFTAAGFTELRP